MNGICGKIRNFRIPQQGERSDPLRESLRSLICDDVVRMAEAAVMREPIVLFDPRHQRAGTSGTGKRFPVQSQLVGTLRIVERKAVVPFS